MARTHVGTTLFVTLAFDHSFSRSMRRKTVWKKKAVGPPHKKYRCVKWV